MLHGHVQRLCYMDRQLLTSNIMAGLFAHKINKIKVHKKCSFSNYECINNINKKCGYLSFWNPPRNESADFCYNRCHRFLKAKHFMHISTTFRLQFYCSNAYRSPTSSYGRSVPLSEEEIQDTLSQKISSPPNAKLLKVAIIGVPNSGKSTLINKLVGWRVCSISKKVHTTICNARAIYNQDETQLVFLDTPGIVTSEEARKYRLKLSLVLDPEISLQQADLIAVLHDVSNKYTRNSLHPRTLRLLSLYPTVPTVLILNKIDVLKSKKNLLSLTKKLTEGKIGNQLTVSPPPPEKNLDNENLKKKLLEDNPIRVKKHVNCDNEDSVKTFDISNFSMEGTKKNSVPLQSIENYPEIESFEKKSQPLELSDIYEKDPINLDFSDGDVLSGRIKLTEQQVKRFLDGRIGWPNFKEVFMVSALEGTGVEAVKSYLKNEAVPNPWIFSDDVITDQSPQEMAILAVREKCLEYFPHAVPYELNFKINYWNISEADVLSILLDVYCRRKNQLKLLIGPSGSKAKLIAAEAEQSLRNAFRTDVRLKLNFEYVPNLKNKVS